MEIPSGFPLYVTIFLYRGRTSTRLRLVPGSNANPKGWHMENPKGFPLYITRVRARVRVCAREFKKLKLILA